MAPLFREPIRRRVCATILAAATITTSCLLLVPGVGTALATPPGTITEYSAGLNTGSEPNNIVSGPDGNVWFVDLGSIPAIGRLTPSGTITEFSTGLILPKEQRLCCGIVSGPDGNLWFADRWAAAIGRITPSGVITEFPTGLSP